MLVKLVHILKDPVLQLMIRRHCVTVGFDDQKILHSD